MGWKRALASKVTDALGVDILRKGAARATMEREYLTTFFREFHVDCVFDLGANAGQYADRVRRWGFRGPIISFEPVPLLATELRAKARSDPAWFIEEIALDEAVHSITFNVLAHSSLSSIYEPEQSLAGEVRKPYRILERLNLLSGTLETYFDKYSKAIGFRRPFLKLDTQGAEIAIAKGAGTRLAQFVGLQSEISFRRSYRNQVTYRDAIEFFEGQGFALTALVPNGFHFPELIELDCFMYNKRIVLGG